MDFELTDKEIESLIQEQKPLPIDFAEKLKLKDGKRGHRRAELSIEGASGSLFKVFMRQSLMNHLDFSVILAYRKPKSTRYFRLRRYNGKSHRHNNRIENQKFYGFHIHEATERYQNFGGTEDFYAEPTDRYADIHQAFECMVQDCGFIVPSGTQTTLFGR